MKFYIFYVSHDSLVLASECGNGLFSLTITLTTAIGVKMNGFVAVLIQGNKKKADWKTWKV